jgi:hypothetical protein
MTCGSMLGLPTSKSKSRGRRWGSGSILPDLGRRRLPTLQLCSRRRGKAPTLFSLLYHSPFERAFPA